MEGMFSSSVHTKIKTNMDIVGYAASSFNPSGFSDNHILAYQGCAKNVTTEVYDFTAGYLWISGIYLSIHADSAIEEGALLRFDADGAGTDFDILEVDAYNHGMERQYIPFDKPIRITEFGDMEVVCSADAVAICILFGDT